MSAIKSSFRNNKFYFCKPFSPARENKFVEKQIDLQEGVKGWIYKAKVDFSILQYSKKNIATRSFKNIP